MLQTSVEIVKPGGTGRPAFVISARPEPLPPSRSFMWRLPSALPPPKKKTFLRWLVAGGRGLARDGFFFAPLFSIYDSPRRNGGIRGLVDLGMPLLRYQ